MYTHLPRAGEALQVKPGLAVIEVSVNGGLAVKLIQLMLKLLLLLL